MAQSSLDVIGAYSLVPRLSMEMHMKVGTYHMTIHTVDTITTFDGV